MVKAYGVRGASGGFGMYQVDVEGVEYPHFDSVTDYLDYVRTECSAATDVVDEDDEDFEAVADADGKTYDQGSGKIVGLRDRKTGHVSLECVYVD